MRSAMRAASQLPGREPTDVDGTSNLKAYDDEDVKTLWGTISS